MKSPVRTRKPKPADEPAAKKPAVMLNYVTLKPRVSEKSYALSEQHNTYIFDVPAGANKFDVAQAVASQYEVSVIKVRLAGVPGKAVRSYRDGGRRSINAKRSDIKKAYVALKEGDKLPIFDAVESDDAPKETK